MSAKEEVVVGTHLVEAFMTKTAKLADVSQEKLFKLISAWNSE